MTAFTRVVWLVTATQSPRCHDHVCDMTHSYVWHECVYMCYMSCNCHSEPQMPRPCVWHDSSICVTWLIYMCDMTQQPPPFRAPDYTVIRVTWLINTYDMTDSYVWHDSLICAAWLMHMCDMTHPHVWHICMRYRAYLHVLYGVATISSLLKIIGVCCKRAI